MKKLRLYLRKYITMLLIDLGILLRPKSKGVMVIDESEWHYPFFNCDFIRTILSQTLSVLLQGYTPYIELKNRKNGETNWDTFFMQPFGASVRNGFSKNGGGYSLEKMPYGYYFHTPFIRHHYKRWCRIFKQMVVLNDKTKQYIDDEYKRIIDPSDKILGVLCRGTDYIGHKGLPVQPSIQNVMSDCKLWMEKYNYKYIYLATESEDIYNQFMIAFPDKVIINQRDYYDKIMTSEKLRLIGEVHFERENDNYIRGLQYLSSLVILSRCDALLAGNCGGTLFSLFYNNMKYEHVKIYNLGIQ